ncbi:alpha/beta hydrolase [Reichenbachiella carrageenanivorans]|uniref:Alpha/beta hydrolase n=1 Tax=Reichenbachiella carrageenanivorans TaxID=2979869 RepID=A0ABY6CWX1_9BACT|nr:alpha/beta hydrolase [Reichenbachiella carrageenanivorans]UXX78219.1 alpha/beta hydrolase [Reichenbachiella carrageenanivorans]
MSIIKINGADIYYEIHGIGPETIVFSHGLLMNGRMFKAQVDYFKARYRCVIYDHRGQGRSEVTAEGYDMESLSMDAIELIKALKLGPCHMVGLSMGGFVAMRLAVHHSEYIKSLLLVETSAEEEPNKFKYNVLKTIVNLFGVKAVINKVMPIMFGQTFLKDPIRKEEVDYWRNEILANEKSITKSVAGVIQRNAISSELGKVSMPTLVIVGDEDVATTVEKAKNIKLKIPQAHLATIKRAGHSSTIEEPRQVIDAIEVFLNGVH